MTTAHRKVRLNGLLIATMCVTAACPDCDSPNVENTIPLITPEQELVELGEVIVLDSATRKVRVRSDGTGTLHIASARLEGSGAFSMTGPGTAELAAGETAQWEVSFAPSLPGEADADLVVESDAQNRPALRIHLHATGTSEPDCNDGNLCTDDAFDRRGGRCVSLPNLGSCDDHNACTTEDRCALGRCLGAGVRCEDANPCTRDLCDMASGCVFIDDARSCDDAEPCTAESCDANGGCAHTPLPDGLVCGLGRDICAGASTCVSGHCTGSPLPDGSACTDFLACTTGDRCVNGVCVGQVPQDAQVSSRLVAFGTRDLLNAVVRGPWLITLERFVIGLHQRGVVALVSVDTRVSPLRPAQVLTLEGVGQSIGLVTASDERLFLVSFTAEGAVRRPRLTVVHFAANGAMTLERTVALPADILPGLTAIGGHDDVAYVCAGPAPLHVVDLLDGQITTLPVDCRALAVDEALATLWLGVWRASSNDAALERWDISSPLTPVREVSVVQTGLGPYALVVAPGLGIFDTNNGDVILHDSDTAAETFRWDELSGVVPSSVGEAFLLRGTSISRVRAGAGGVVSEVVGSLPLPEWATPSGVRAGNALMLWAYDSPVRLFKVDVNGALAESPVDVRGFGGFQLVHEVEGAIMTLAPEGTHLLHLDGTDFDFAVSRPFTRHAALISPATTTPAPAYFVSRSEWGDSGPAGAFAAAGAWLDGNPGSTTELLGMLQTGLGASRGDGRYRYVATTYAQDAGDHRVQLGSHDMAAWVPSAAFSPSPQRVLDLHFVDDRAWQETAVAIDAPGGRLLVTAQFIVPGNDNGVHLAMLDVAGTEMTLRWQTVVSTVPYEVYDVAFSGDDVLLVLKDPGEYRWAHRIEHYRYVEADGALRVVATLESPEVMNALMFDGRVLMASTPGGMRLVSVSEEALELLAEVPLMAPASAATVAQDRLWVTTTGSVEVFYPPCPPAP